MELLLFSGSPPMPAQYLRRQTAFALVATTKNED
jgi:hypothetical protein